MQKNLDNERDRYGLTKIIVIIFVMITPLFTLQAREGHGLVKIGFTGNETLKSGTLMDQIVMKNPHNFYGLLFWKKPFRFSRNVLEKDIQRIKTFYHTEGFLKVQINPELIPAGEKKIKVILHINEGEPVIVRDILFRFTEDSTACKKIIQKTENEFTTVKNDRFRDENIRSDRNRIIFEFVNSGYPKVDIELAPRIGEKKESVKVIFDISPGPLCTFGKIDVFGESQTPADFITERLLFQEGDTFSRKLVEQSQRNIYQLYLFEFVNIRVLLDEHVTELPVRVRVKDAPRLTAKFGAGYGKEDRFRVFSELQRLRFLGRTRRLHLYAKHSFLEPWHVNAKILQPGFLGPQTHLNLNPFYKREREPAYTIDRIGGNIILQNQFNKMTEIHLAYLLEQNRLYNVMLDPNEMENLTLYNKSAVRFGLTRDSSSPVFSPVKGWLNAVKFTFSGLGFKSDFFYFQALTEHRKYVKFLDENILALKFKVGSMAPLKSDHFTPIEERFYAGGSNSIRGWARSRVGPKGADGDPVGGNSILEGSAEVRFPIYKQFSGVSFFDFGNVWRKSLTFDMDDLKYAAGVGLRYKTAIGPIRVDVGIPVFDTQKQIQFHLSVGQAF